MIKKLLDLIKKSRSLNVFVSTIILLFSGHSVFSQCAPDITPPTALCQNITVNLEASGSISITPSDLDNGSTDNCGTITFTADKTGFTCNDIGSNTVTLTVTDAAGNTATCTANVTVVDLIAPTITCPLPITVDQDAGTCGAIVNFTTPVDGSLRINTSGTLNPGPSLAASGGTTNWSSVAYNPDLDLYYAFRAGNTGMPFRTYDGTGATLATNTTGFDFRGLWWNPNTKELQGNGVGTSGYRTVTLDASGYATNGGTNFVTGINQPNNQSNGAYDYNNNEIIFYHNARLYTYDLDGNQLTDNAIVNFPEASNGDITTRSVGYTGIPGKEIIIYSELNARVYFIDKATATYNGDFLDMPAGAPTPNNYGFSYANGYVFLREDSSADPWVSYQIVIDDRLDNCDNTTITQTSGLVSGSTFPVGTSTVEFTAEDASGNTTICTFDITVNDITPPTPVCQDITIQLDASGNATITSAQIDNGSSDECGIDTLILDLDTFDCTHIGTNNVVLTVTDNNSNSDTCNAVVTVQDNIPPTVVCQNITVQLDATGNVTITPAQIDNGSTDACGIATTVLDNTTFDCTNIGTNNVVLTVTDNNGNSNTCTAVVTVQDNVQPNVICQDITVQLNTTGNVTITATDVDNGSTDACGIASYILDIYNFNCSHVGTNSVTLTVTDIHGNSANCAAIVTVEDNLLPVANNPVLLPVYEACSLDTITPPTATDNCANTITGTTTTAFPVLVSTTITWSFDDSNGNVITQDQEVTIEDTFAPIPDNTSLEEVNVTCILNNLPAPTGSDECAGIVTATTNTLFPITQSTLVEWTFTDGANSTTQNQQVTIHDSTPTNHTANAVTNGTGDKATITVNLTGSEYANYEVQLGNDPWIPAERDGNTFIVTFSDVFIPISGLQIINLRSTDGCWHDSIEIPLVGYRGSFTPNADGIHDTWNMIGLTNSNPNASITIFNRLGKLLAQITPSGAGWDGTYNGVPVPSSEYWFKVSYTEVDSDGNQVPRNISGHFSLIR